MKETSDCFDKSISLICYIIKRQKQCFSENEFELNFISPRKMKFFINNFLTSNEYQLKPVGDHSRSSKLDPL